MEAEVNATGSCAICARPNRTYYTYCCPGTGLVICTACRIFYVDSIRQNIYPSFECKAQQNCDLAVKRGKNLCKYCKFQKCQEVGLTQESIKPTRKYVTDEQDQDQQDGLPTAKRREKKLKHAKLAWIEQIQKNYEEAILEVPMDQGILESICQGHCRNWVPAKHSNEVLASIKQGLAVARKMLEKDLTFQSLCRADQILLFNNNAPMYGMYLLASYLTAPSGTLQLYKILMTLCTTITGYIESK